MTGLHPKTLFLIDSLGALFSAFMLGIILVRFESTFGMPRSVLYVLSILALLFAIYSLVCSLTTKEKWKLYMKIIAFINLQYCCLTAALVYYFHKELTALGFAYFIIEIVIIVILAVMELRIAAKSSS